MYLCVLKFSKYFSLSNGPKFTKSLVEKAIDPVFPIIPQKNSSSSSDENNFEQQFQSLKMPSEGGGDVAKTNKMIDDGFEFICFK